MNFFSRSLSPFFSGHRFQFLKNIVFCSSLTACGMSSVAHASKTCSTAGDKESTLITAPPEPAIQEVTLCIKRESLSSLEMTTASVDLVKEALKEMGIAIQSINFRNRTMVVQVSSERVKDLRRIERVSGIWNAESTVNYYPPGPGELSPEEVRRQETLNLFDRELNDSSRISRALQERIGSGSTDEVEISVMILDNAYRGEYMELLRALEDLHYISFHASLDIFGGFWFRARAAPEAIKEIVMWEPLKGRPDGHLIKYVDVYGGPMTKQISAWLKRQ